MVEEVAMFFKVTCFVLNHMSSKENGCLVLPIFVNVVIRCYNHDKVTSG